MQNNRAHRIRTANHPHKPFFSLFSLALCVTLLAFCVVVLGAYTRLTDAGLGCPDWPGCYGRLIPETPSPLNPIIQPHKAWTEMSHRYLAGLLGITILLLAIRTWYARRTLRLPAPYLPMALVLVVLFQALLGKWTVTLKLMPWVVMAHLLGGFTTLSLLWWLTLDLKPIYLTSGVSNTRHLNRLKIVSRIALLILVIQLFLGGWTSANYAALVCLDFPYCEGKLIPELDFRTAFNLMSAGVVGSTGAPLGGIARVTIHMMHRLGALVTSGILGWLVFQLFSNTSRHMRRMGCLILGLLLLQITLGILNVVALLPLPIAVAHNAIAALLLLALVTLTHRLYANRLRYRADV